MTCGPFANVRASKLEEMLDVNLYQLEMIIHAFLPSLIKREKAGKRSAIIATSSSSCLHYFPNNLVYTATKAFVTQLCQGIASELKQKGSLIDLHCTVPFATKTNIVNHWGMDLVGTPVGKAVNIWLRDLGHWDLSYGTKSNEIFARGYFGAFSSNFEPVFNFTTAKCFQMIKFN